MMAHLFADIIRVAVLCVVLTPVKLAEDRIEGLLDTLRPVVEAR